MRVLLTAAAIPSHFSILVPLALALRDAGHDVAVASGPNVVPRIEQLGIPAFSVGTAPAARTPPPADPKARLRWAWEEYFVGSAGAQRLRDLLGHARAWQPALIVRENAELAGCVAAEALGIPHAVIQNGNIDAARRLPDDLFTAWLDGLRAAAGLPPDPERAMLARYLLLLPVPRSFHDPSIPLPATAHFLRPFTFDRTDHERLPAWLEDLPQRPTVYMTLGTVYNARLDLFTMAIEALRDEPVNLIVTVGRDQDPAQFGPQPPHLRIERYIPNSLLLPRCNLMINCASMNSLRSAFEDALPLVLLPLAAHHPLNAARCETLGVARVLDPRTATPAALREAVSAVLAEPSYRANVLQLQHEVMAMPGIEQAIELIERLATDRRPIPSLG